MPAPPLPEPELPPPEVGVAPLGVAPPPPPVGPEAPLEPDPLVPLEVPPAVPDEPDELEAGDELAPEDADAPEEEEPPPVDEEFVVVVVDDVVELVVALCGVAATVAVGTVRGGAPAVSVAGPVPPHAATPAPSASPASRPPTSRPGRLTRFTTRRSGTTETSDVERLHAPSAVGAIVQILLAELVAPVAEPQVLDRPGQLRRGGGEGKKLGDHLERLAGLAIHVHPTGLGLYHDLTPGGRRPHPVPLTRPHSEPSYSRARRGVPSRPATGVGEAPCRPLG
jgi:hypothetical protein